MLSSITVCVVTHESLFLCVCVCGWGGPCTEIDHVKQRLLSAPQSINVWAFKLHTVSFLHTPGYTLMQTNRAEDMHRMCVSACTGCTQKCIWCLRVLVRVRWFLRISKVTNVNGCTRQLQAVLTASSCMSVFLCARISVKETECKWHKAQKSIS